MSEWQPIETCPTGARDVLLYTARGKMFVGWKHSAGYFLDHRSDLPQTEERAPTHWMPLPSPPE